MPSGFSLTHQRVVVDLDLFEGAICGYTELSVIPLDPLLRSISLDARNISIDTVTVNGRSTPFRYTDPSVAKMHDTSTVYQHEMLREKLWQSPDTESDNHTLMQKPSLFIPFPKGTRPELYKDPNATPIRIKLGRITSESRPRTTIVTNDPPIRQGPLSVYSPITIRVDFRGRAVPGIQFVGMNGESNYPQLYTTNYSLPGSTSSWLPCLDGLWNKCTWDCSLSFPRTVVDIERAHKFQGSEDASNVILGNEFIQSLEELDDDGDDDRRLAFTAVCSGDKVDEIPHDTNPYMKTLKFALTAPVAAHHIAFAIGPFTVTKISDSRETEEDDAMGSNAVEILAYSLPRRESMMKNTCLFLYKAVDFFVRDFGSYPFTSFKLCFVDGAAVPAQPSAALTICSNHLLFPPDIIDPMFSSTRILTHALACQWAGINIVPATFHDFWTTIGISYFLTDLFLRRLMGNNNYRYRLKRASDDLYYRDVNQAPIGRPCVRLPITSQTFNFIERKAPLVLFILNQRLSKMANTLGLPRIISKLFLASMTSGVDESSISTTQFQRQCEKICHLRLDEFFAQWVYKSGCPSFSVVQRFNKKKMIIEVGIRQMQITEEPIQRLNTDRFISQASEYLDDGAILKAERQAFTGPMTIRIHEADGTPYEHIIEIKDAFTKLDVPYNTKYRRLKKSSHRVRQQRMHVDRAESVPMKEFPTHEDGPIDCLGDVLQSSEDVQAWRLTDWTMEDDANMLTEAFEWIRIDADFEWLCQLTLNQPDYMYLSQLQQDQDVIAQYDALKYFQTSKESAMTSTILLRTLADNRYYYELRCDAALALANVKLIFERIMLIVVCDK